MFTLQNRRLRGKYLMGRSKEDGVRLLSVVSSERTRGYGNKSK